MASIQKNQSAAKKKKPLSPKKKPKKLSKARQELLKKAQAAGGLSDIAFSHTSKATILKKFRSDSAN